MDATHLLALMGTPKRKGQHPGRRPGAPPPPPPPVQGQALYKARPEDLAELVHLLASLYDLEHDR